MSCIVCHYDNIVPSQASNEDFLVVVVLQMANNCHRAKV